MVKGYVLETRLTRPLFFLLWERKSILVKTFQITLLDLLKTFDNILFFSHKHSKDQVT